MRQGLARHGIKVEFTARDDPIEGADFHVTWSIKRPNIFRWKERTGRHVLVMERGYLPDRFVYSSIGWDGLNNRAIFPEPEGWERWDDLFSQYLKPWRETNTGNALLCGQVPGDSALYGMDMDAWARETARELQGRGYRVLFRPHPLTVRRNGVTVPEGAERAPGETLEDSLEHVDLCVTYNSNAGVESVLHGTPTVTLDKGAMAWGVSSHDYSAVRPDRETWAFRMAWCQWTLDEIADGTAWQALKTCVEL